MKKDSQRTAVWMEIIARALTRFMRAVQKGTGSLLAGAAVTLQVGNILICVCLLLLGPAVIINLLVK
jgi:hypothetical protein